MVSILIPNKDHVEELRNCIQSIEKVEIQRIRGSAAETGTVPSGNQIV